MKKMSINIKTINYFKFIAIIFGTIFGVITISFADDDPLKLSKSGSEKVFLNPKPWSGYWWSRKEGENLEAFDKYDHYVRANGKPDPRSYFWEKDIKNGHYDPSSPGWAGHCNGWSAASILEPEPLQPQTVKGVTFSVADQKALLSEMYMDCYTEFYGERNESFLPKSRDFPPDLFHRLLVDNLKNKKRGIVADTSNSASVWNYPICGYESHWNNIPLLPSQIRVTTTVYYADDDVDANFVGNKPMVKTYHYILSLNKKGEVIKGIWELQSQFDHPDFIWIPTGDSPSQGDENPKLDPFFVHQITRGGEAVIQPIQPNFDIEAENVLTEAGLRVENILK
ncbi:MAG: hypothetical protein HQM08_22645 [Candidatus Riflebacteria bacterium]|nr:hypothetical protein [Candidatus Riflebacteria bacterium]